MRLASTCVRSLLRRADERRDLWVLDGDLADSYDAQLFEEAVPDRFVMCGIAEQNMVSVAAGLAASGQRPWVFSFAAFLAHRANDQIRVSMCQSDLPVTLVGSHAGGCGGRNGKSHQTTNDLAAVGVFPGLRAFAPGDPADVESVIDEVLDTAAPSYVRTPRDDCPPLPGSPGTVRWLTPPTEHLVITHGLSSQWAFDALGDEPSGVSIIHCRRIAPVPREIVALVASARSWSVVEDHVWHGGLASRLIRATGRMPTRWLGWPDHWPGGSGSSDELRRSQGLDPRALRAALVGP